MIDGDAEDNEGAGVLLQLAVDRGVEPHTNSVGAAVGGIEFHGAGIEQNHVAADESDRQIHISGRLTLGENDIGVRCRLVGIALNILHDNSNQAHAMVAICIDIREGNGDLVAGNRDGTKGSTKAGTALGEFELPGEYASGVLATLPNCNSLAQAVGVERGAVGEATAHTKAAQGFDGD